MDNFELDKDPFYSNPCTSVALFKGVSIARNRLPVVVKRHCFSFIQQKRTQDHMTQTLNAALVQAKVQHPNSCDILEVQLQIKENSCTICHVLEALDGDVEQDIEQRRLSNRHYNEAELRQMLLQIGSALACAHSKKIAHRDVKPSNIFQTGGTYKIGDFGCFYLQRQHSTTMSVAGDFRYMSPQLRGAFVADSKYNAFKADVFALGASLLYMAALNQLESSLGSEQLEQVVSLEVAKLPYSTQLKTLLLQLLAHDEDQRPTMKEVCSAVESLEGTLPSADSKLISSREQGMFSAVYEDQLELFNLKTQQLTQYVLPVNLGSGGSYAQLDGSSLLCVGGNPASADVCRLDLISLQFTSLPPLTVRRAWAGVIQAADSIYVFGGWDYPSSLNSCEKSQLSNNEWRPMGSMVHARDGFTPCAFQTSILLASPQTPIERFHPETETFTVLPFAPLHRSCFSVAFVIGEELFLLTSDKHLARLKLEPGNEFRVSNTDRECWSTQSPLVTSSYVFIANQGSVEKFCLRTFTFLSLETP